MNKKWLLMLLASLLLAGCGGGDPGANKGMDRPIQPKKDK